MAERSERVMTNRIHCLLAASVVVVTTAGKWSTEKTSRGQYLGIRKQFAQSRYAEIRDPGVRFADELWQIQATNGDYTLALAIGITAFGDYSTLSGGCA